MKQILFLVLILVNGFANAQSSEYVTTSFCGKSSNEYEGKSSCTVSELRSCNLQIVTEDTSLQVNSFFLTIQPLANPVDIESIAVRGNKIPQKYIEKLCAAKNFRIEKILIVDKADNAQQVLPIVISVMP